MKKTLTLDIHKGRLATLLDRMGDVFEEESVAHEEALVALGVMFQIEQLRLNMRIDDNSPFRDLAKECLAGPQPEVH